VRVTVGKQGRLDYQVRFECDWCHKTVSQTGMVTDKEPDGVRYHYHAECFAAYEVAHHKLIGE
jgi:hypothetical protein